MRLQRKRERSWPMCTYMEWGAKLRCEKMIHLCWLTHSGPAPYNVTCTRGRLVPTTGQHRHRNEQNQIKRHKQRHSQRRRRRQRRRQAPGGDNDRKANGNMQMDTEKPVTLNTQKLTHEDTQRHTQRHTQTNNYTPRHTKRNNST